VRRRDARPTRKQWRRAAPAARSAAGGDRVGTGAGRGAEQPRVLRAIAALQRVLVRRSLLPVPRQPLVLGRVVERPLVLDRDPARAPLRARRPGGILSRAAARLAPPPRASAVGRWPGALPRSLARRLRRSWARTRPPPRRRLTGSGEAGRRDD